ncbi:MAG: four helix bundle suffix domain-containing protein [Kiritimatiellae bacterium]|nr:four helix bundle suffix domain-containing protein [Kiritimatiellia bacterium]
MLPHGGYRKLIVYRKSETVYQGTVAFCRRFLPARGDRTVDQMVQAARSCKQNIAEGSAASGTSKETEIKLTNVARATLDELREDYLDRLRARGMEPWGATDERSVAARAFAKAHPDWDDWKEIFESRPEETLCNLMLTLCHQTRTLLDGMIKRQEEDFRKFGGVRERMHAARTEARGEVWDKTLYSRLDSAPDAAELRRRAEEIRREATRAERSIARRKGWATPATTGTLETRGTSGTGVPSLKSQGSQGSQQSQRSRAPLLAALAAALLVAAPAFSDIIPGLEEFGELTLVDSVECATDTAHRFRDYPAGRSYVTNILGEACVAMHPVADSETPKGQRQASFVSWRLGEGKGIEAGTPYVLAIDYPDDAPRSASVMNFGNWTIHGFATGFATPDCYWPEYVHPLHESYALPLSGEVRTFKEVMFPMEQCQHVETAQKDGAEVYDLPSGGFDVAFALFSKDRQPDSLGVAVKAIRLYRVDDYAAARPEIHYPLGDAPRRHVTFREEMGDSYMLQGYKDGNKTDAYRDKARLMSLLGVDTTSRDLLEFGYVQYWNSSWSSGPYGHTDGYAKFGGATDYWTDTVRLMAEEGHYILPYYEYSGGRGNNGWGNVGAKPITLRAGNGGFSNQSWINSSLADVTHPSTREEMKELLDLSLLRYASEERYRGVFLGAWFRNRFQLPMGFSDAAIASFNAERGYHTSRTAIYAALTNEQARIQAAGGAADWNCKEQWGPQVYKDYRAWWYGKRRDLFATLRDYLTTNGMPQARVFYHGTQAEPGEQWNGWSPPNSVFSPDESCLWNGTDWKTFTGFNGETDIAGLAAGYKTHSLDQDFGDAQGWEYGHANPRHDPENYTAQERIGLSYPYSRVFQVVDPAVSAPYRNASGDLFFVHHYSLNEHNLQDKNVADDGRQQIAGYFCSDYDHAGRGVNLDELWAMTVADPTMLARLYGTNLGQLDSGYFREFNLNFLSLPAQPGTLVAGGSWGEKLHVRRWDVPASADAPACTYFAVINTDVHPYEGPVPFSAGFAHLWRTVDYGEIDLDAAGSAQLSLEPLQMVAFRSVPPDAPALRVRAAADASGLAGSAEVEVLALPSAPGTLELSWSTRTDGLGGAAAAPVALSGKGSFPFALAGLDPAAKYFVRAVVTGADGVAATNLTSFRTADHPGYPRAAVSARGVGASSATLVADFASIGAGASSVTVYATVQDAAGLFPAQSFSFPGPVYPAAIERAVAGLSSRLAYFATLYATNDLGRGCALGSVSFTTGDAALQEPGGGRWEPGLVQHRFKMSAQAVPDTSMRVKEIGDPCDERILAPMIGQDNKFTNPLTGTAWDILKFPDGTSYGSGEGQEPYRGGFLYEGAMWFEGGVDYHFYHRYADNANVWIDDAPSSPATGATGGYSYTTYWTVRYEESGWHPIRIWFWSFTGSYGRQGGLLYGVAWNTNGLETASSGSAGWSQLRDPGDGSFLRTYDPDRVLADIDRPLARSGSALVVPVAIDSYDADNELTVYASSSLPADPHDPAAWRWSAAGASPPVGASRQELSVAGAAPAAGATVYAIARLRNARTGVDGWSEVASYARPAGSAPEVFASLVSVSPHGATFSVRVVPSSGSATLSAALSGASSGSWTVASGLSASSAPVEWTVPATLAAASDFSIVFTASGNGGTGTSGEIAFTTAGLEPPAATLAATAVSFESESFRVDVSSLGTDSTYADVRMQLSTSEDFTSGVQTRTSRVNAAGGSAAFTFPSLSAGTVYWARAVVAGSAGTSFTTPAQRVPTTAYTPPVFGRVAADDVDPESATLSVELLDLGAGSTAATVSWTCSGGGRTWSGQMGFPGAATKAAALSGLAPETEYTVALVAAGAHSQRAETSLSFTTPRYPVLLQSASAAVSRAGTSVALSATVARADAPATLSLYVAGSLAERWTGLAPGDVRTWESAVALGATNDWRFVLASGAWSDERTGTFIARRSVAWFDAPFEDAAYASWRFAAGADPYGGGSWTRPAGDASAFVAGSGAHLDVAAPRGGVVYTATEPSRAPRDVLVEGRALFTASAAPLSAEPDGTRAGLVLHVEPDGTERFYGYDGAAWVALSGSPQPAADTWCDYTAEFCFSAAAPAVRYTLGGVPFTRASDGEAWIPLAAAAPRALEGVAFDGDGAAGAFRADWFVYDSADDATDFSAAATDVAADSATVAVDVYSLAPGGAAFAVRYAESESFAGAVAAGSRSATAAGRLDFPLSGLAAGRTYWVEVVATDAATGATLRKTFSFTTVQRIEPPEGSLAVVDVSQTGAVAVVSLASVGAGADSVGVSVQLSTRSDFASFETFPGAAATASGSQRIALGPLDPATAYYARAVFAGSSTVLSAVVPFTTLPVSRREVAWFDVDWASDGYAQGAAWPTAAAAGASGGTWTRTAADASSLGSAGLALDGFEPLAFVPTAPSREDCDVRVEGVATVRRGLQPAPAGRAGLSFAEGAVYGLAGGAWVALAATPPADGARVAWAAEFDFSSASAPRVRYLLGGEPVAAAATGETWIPTTGSSVSGVSFLGRGTLGDFKGLYWETDPPPPPGRLALGPAVAEVAATGTNALVSVAVESVAEGAVLALFWNGAEAATWSAPEAGRAYTNAFEVALGSTNAFRFVLSAPGLDSAVREGRVVARRLVDWFHVQWAADGYAPGTAWNTAAAESASGGTWTRPAFDASTLSGGALAVSLPAGSFLRFAASDPAATPTGSLVRIEGRARFPAAAAPATPFAGTLVALSRHAAGEEGGAALHAWTAPGGWTALSGDAPAAGAWADWAVDLDFATNPPRARVSVGGELRARASDGAEWIPLDPAAAAAHGVAYAGAGEAGDFRAEFRTGLAAEDPLVVEPVAPSAAGARLSFVSDGGAESFRIRLAEPEPGRHYAAFAADDLAAAPSDWICVGFGAAPAAGPLDFDVETAGHPSRFFQIWTVSRTVPRPATLVEFLGE